MTLPAAGPEPGSYAVDLRSGRVGRVMAYLGPDAYLRPLGGGREWECPPGELKAASFSELLRARVRECNAQGRLP
ncbi:hypothetical protein [Streptomyces sp. C10-9-1]|uniref:hypothetical protein n=1 Tax=Streptomyces sp. C10-9-1 TaxID=1859285 RepID=UPI003F4A8243